MFKGYSSKSKAKRGLESYAKSNNVTLTEEDIATRLYQGEGDKWGFDIVDPETEAGDVKDETGDTTVVDKDNVDTFTGAGIGTELQPVGDITLNVDAPSGVYTPEGGDVQSEEDGESQQNFAPASMFGGLAATLGAVAATATPPVSATRAISRNNYTIEKNRPEQNGIKRPSEGGLCRAVWDFLDDTREKTGAIPVAKQVREKAEEMEWNMNNALIEFYQWRKFNGIIGRTSTKAAA